MNEEDTDDEDVMTDDEDNLSAAGARPRRVSDLPASKSKPIPPASSLFIFSSTNK